MVRCVKLTEHRERIEARCTFSDKTSELVRAMHWFPFIGIIIWQLWQNRFRQRCSFLFLFKCLIGQNSKQCLFTIKTMSKNVKTRLLPLNLVRDNRHFWASVRNWANFWTFDNTDSRRRPWTWASYHVICFPAKKGQALFAKIENRED